MITPAKYYFLIRIRREEESQRKEKIGNIILAPSQVFMTRNTQCGEIVAIGELAQKHFPEARIGHTLLVHHFVQGQNETDAREDHLVDQDGEYNYYVVSAYSFHRKNNETYAVWDGEKIIPNKDYIFLEPEMVVDPKSPDEYIEAALKKTDSGLLVFENWKDSRETQTEKIKSLKTEIDALCKSGTHKPHVQKAIEQKEAEIKTLSANLNKRCYEPYTIAAFNPSLREDFKMEICKGDEIWMSNISTQTEIEFNGSRYRVAKIDYIGCINKGQGL